MKKFFPYSFLFMSLFVMSGCSFLGKTMKQPNYRVEFDKDDFEWSPQVTGEATQVKVLNIDWARLFKQTGGEIDGSDRYPSSTITIPIIGYTAGSGPRGNSIVEMYALYEMMTNNPGFDLVVYPSFETTMKGFPFIFWKTTVKATARLGKLK